METSERITWEECPTCRHTAAVGWSDAEPVEFDCPTGCALDAEELRAFLAGGERPSGT